MMIVLNSVNLNEGILFILPFLASMLAVNAKNLVVILLWAYDAGSYGKY